MLAIERKTRILEILQKEKIVKVEALSGEFGVSVMTIRRDLEKCEKEGLIRRCHGGAVLTSEISPEVYYADKIVSRMEAKDKIARHAAAMVRPGNTIFLDAGTTILNLAKRLLDAPDLTVVTNDLAIAGLMSERNTRVIMLGGLVSNALGSTHGYMTDRMLQELRVETAFTGGQTINESFELYATTESKVNFRRLLMRQANRVYLLVDATKFYKQALFKIHGLDEYAGVITDKRIIDTEQQFLNEHGINLISLADRVEAQAAV